MIKGNVGYDGSKERYVVYGNFGEERELHCGDSFEVWVRPNWERTRIELNDEGIYYLIGCSVGLAEIAMYGLPVKI